MAICDSCQELNLLCFQWLRQGNLHTVTFGAGRAGAFVAGEAVGEWSKVKNQGADREPSLIRMRENYRFA